MSLAHNTHEPTTASQEEPADDRPTLETQPPKSPRPPEPFDPLEHLQEDHPNRGIFLSPDDPSTFGDFARDLQHTCLIGDPWNVEDGLPRFCNTPLILSHDTHARLEEAASRVGELYAEAMAVIWDRPKLLDTFFDLTPYQKFMWMVSEGRWHGFARMDLFICKDGSFKVCELNADTPSGQTDALIPTQLLQEANPELIDPNASYRERFLAMVQRNHLASTAGASNVPKRVGIIYPTDQPEDITIVRLYQQWLESIGCETILGSPFNVVDDPNTPNGVLLFGQPVDMVLRHYKTDWWGERLPIWSEEEPYDDPDPLDTQIILLARAEQARSLSLINPWGAILAQNKVTLAFFWEHFDLFSARSQETIRLHIPESRRIDTIGREHLLNAREEWVLKSDFGCEGDEVIIGPYTTPEDWKLALELAIPGIWVAQRFFEIQPIQGRYLPNYGVYLIAGQPSGFLTRLDPLGEMTGYTSKVAPTLVDPLWRDSTDA